jgi:hypothetical protein
MIRQMFAILMMLAAELTCLQAQNSAGNPPVQISTNQLNKLIAATLDAKAQGPMSQRMTRLLGLTQGDEKLVVKQFYHSTDTITNFFTVPVDVKIDRLIFIIAEKDHIQCIVTDRSGQLVAGNAGASVRRGEQPVLLSASETMALYTNQMAIWMETADRIKSP